MSWLSKFFSKSHKQRQLSSEDCCMHGQQAFAIGKYVEAMEYFQAAIEKDAQNEEAYLLLIDAYRALDVIDNYVKNNGGTCTRTEAKPVKDK